METLSQLLVRIKQTDRALWHEKYSGLFVTTPIGSCPVYMLLSDRNMSTDNGLLNQLIERFGDGCTISGTTDGSLPPVAESLLTTAEAAKLLRCSVRIVSRLIDGGGLRGFKMPTANGGNAHRRTTVGDVLDYMIDKNIPIPLEYSVLAQQRRAARQVAAAG